MPHAIEGLSIKPLPAELRKDTQLGAEICLPSTMPLLDVQTLSDGDKSTLRNALFENGVIVFRNQMGIEPGQTAQLAKLFDDTALDIHSGGAKQITSEKNILSQNNCSRVPRAPQVTVIGQGKVRGHEDIPELQLKHLDHTSFHEEPLSQDAIEEGYTRPYRWHMDAPLYENLPGFATTLHAIEVPDLPNQKLAFPDGSEMEMAAGATVFFSGARNFELLSSEEQEFALNTTVQYAPRAYEWIRDCKATADGLSIARPGREKPIDELPSFDPSKVHAFPMVWRNSSTQRPHLQILGCCAQSLRTTDPSTGTVSIIDDIAEARRISHTFQSKVYSAQNVYAHRWRKGDLVVFHNRGVMHSITGQLSRYADQRRLMWQCSMASGTAPTAFRESRAIV